MRNKRELNAKLKGTTLGDAEADVDDTLKWIKRSKKREKELAKKRQEELDNLDKVLQDEYTESESSPTSSTCVVLIPPSEDLEGLKVAHDFDALEDGEERILTLKDSRILEDEGQWYHCCLHIVLPNMCCTTEDALENVELAEDERTKKNKEMKIKRRDYTGYDDDEFVAGNEGMKRSLLAKYDEFLEGPKDTVSAVWNLFTSRSDVQDRTSVWVVHQHPRSQVEQRRRKRRRL